MESGSPSGKEALEVRYAAKDGSGHVRFVGGRSTDGRLWRLSVAALVESIEGGREKVPQDWIVVDKQQTQSAPLAIASRA